MRACVRACVRVCFDTTGPPAQAVQSLQATALASPVLISITIFVPIMSIISDRGVFDAEVKVLTQRLREAEERSSEFSLDESLQSAHHEVTRCAVREKSLIKGPLSRNPS